MIFGLVRWVSAKEWIEKMRSECNHKYGPPNIDLEITGRITQRCPVCGHVKEVQSLYWRDVEGFLRCPHGVILYGTKCINCERAREKTGAKT